jgi:thiamine kinase-like enzyme
VLSRAQHPSWSAEAALASMERAWTEDESLPSDLVNRLLKFLTDQREDLAAVYEPPHFVHGDCHAHQFFIESRGGAWRVSGVVDIEVASAGDSGMDVGKFSKEMAPRYDSSTRWWVPFFEGYGGEPSFELMKLRLAGSPHITFIVYGEHSWPGTRAEITRHILDAADWEHLFDTRRIGR